MRKAPSVLAFFLLAGLLAARGEAAPDPVALSPEAKIDPWIRQRLLDRGADSFLVLFEPARADREIGVHDGAGGRATYDRLRTRAKEAQAATRRFLDARGIAYRKLYVVNALQVEGDLDLARALAERIEVARIVGDPAVRAIESSGGIEDAVATVEWNIAAVKANTVWTFDGVRGEGIVLASADSGVFWSHPALQPSYAGWDGSSASHDFHWHDAIAGSVAPFDDLGHGTHTVGIMVGDDGVGNQVGVAPKAKWIACRNMNVGVGQPSTYIDCLQYFLAPYPHGGDPEEDGDPSKAPHIVNNSWYCPPSEGCDPDTLTDAFEALRDAGILAVAAAGNDGSACGTVNDPPEFLDQVLAVGYTTSTNALAGLSARGPVTIDGSNRLKPDLSAPGASIRSTLRIGGYGLMSGTSMASPHVAGAAALLWSARPQFRGRIAMTRCLLTRATSFTITTTPGETCGGTNGTVRPNNLFGWGLLDASNAIHLGPDPDADGVGDACDCAPSNGGAFDLPIEVAGVVFAADHATLSWPPVAASAGAGTVYDVVRGDILDLRASGSIVAAGCVGGGLTAPSLVDGSSPLAGHALYYVVQARNACGSGGWGFDSAGNAHTHATCP